MRIGAALTLIAIGAILKFAITVHSTHGFNVNTAGVILMVVGIIGLLAEVVFMSMRRRTDVVHETPAGATRTTYTEPPVERY
ncbi:MAG TPA: hypothetical protein VGN18_06715 [Jatrophihabitans sp.]|jgi:membrane-bound ClpP family serine protease|uniref:hypothetical protein n=1 Tax=Jatrophihabitans sp. TaxID=1932789 RepID=UPI002DF927D5|nr:hypothetical protein [Jatrophihabitans sp.]